MIIEVIADYPSLAIYMRNSVRGYVPSEMSNNVSVRPLRIGLKDNIE
jgi:hypothetical protein